MPQIELMQSDLPHTLFKTTKKGNSKTATAVDDEAERLMMESIKRSEERRRAKAGGESYTIDEIFNGKADD